MSRAVPAARPAAPSDYTELFRNYHHFVRRRVIAHGIEERNADDVTSDLLVRFMEKRSLERYDPTLTFEKAGILRTCSFPTYIGSFVDKHVLGLRDKQNKQRRREPLVCDVPISADNGGEPVTWVEYNEERLGRVEPSHEDHVIHLILAEGLVEQMRAYLADVPPRNAFDHCDLVAVFNLIVAQVLSNDHLDFQQLAADLGVSPTTANNYCWRVRELLCDVAGRPVPPKRRRSRRNGVQS